MTEHARRRSTFFRLLTVASVLATVFWSALIVRSQESDHAGRVRGLNAQVLQLLGQLQSGPGARGAALRAQIGALLEQRMATLTALMEGAPADALRLALPADVVADLAAAVPAARAQLESRGVWQGPVEYAIEDDFAGRSHRTVITMAAGGESLIIRFAGREPAELRNGDTVEVRGVRVGTVVVAESSAVTGASASSRGPKPTLQPCSTFGAQPTIVLLVTMPGAVIPPEITPDIMDDTFFNPDADPSLLSLTDFWLENSSGATWAVGDIAQGTMTGWYMLDRVYSEDETGQIRTAAIAAADPDVDFTRYKRVYIVVNGSTAGTNPWSGRGTVGCGTQSSQDGDFIASTAWQKTSTMLGPRHGVQVIVHEGGHNLGLGHSNSREFGAEALGAPGAAGVVDEYNDMFAEMGRGFGHYAAPHKTRLGWLSTDVQTVTGSGSYVLNPVAVPGGAVRALKIRRGSDNANWLWIEYRQPVGRFDTRLVPPLVNYLDEAESHVYSGGLIHYEDATTGNETHLLDLTPASRSGNTLSTNVDDDWFDPALVGTWTDPYTGLSITTSNPTSSSLTVSVSYGSGPCLEANPTVTLSPGNASAKRGGTVNFTVTVTNNDSLPCAGKTFALSSAFPSDWPSSFSSSPVALAAGASAIVTMTKTVPSNVAYATFAVDATATSGAFAGTGGANVTVKPGK